MRTKFFEAISAQGNWGKFMLGQFDAEEIAAQSEIPTEDGFGAGSMIQGRGWAPGKHWFVMDLQTGEGAYFSLGGYAEYDLSEKHNIWVCPLFPPFLTWLYARYNAGEDLWELPRVVRFEDVPLRLSGDRGGKPVAHN